MTGKDRVIRQANLKMAAKRLKLALVLVLVLGGCGARGAPEAPPGEPPADNNPPFILDDAI